MYYYGNQCNIFLSRVKPSASINHCVFDNHCEKDTYTECITSFYLFNNTYECLRGNGLHLCFMMSLFVSVNNNNQQKVYVSLKLRWVRNSSSASSKLNWINHMREKEGPFSLFKPLVLTNFCFLL